MKLHAHWLALHFSAQCQWQWPVCNVKHATRYVTSNRSTWPKYRSTSKILTKKQRQNMSLIQLTRRFSHKQKILILRGSYERERVPPCLSPQVRYDIARSIPPRATTCEGIDLFKAQRTVCKRWTTRDRILHSMRNIRHCGTRRQHTVHQTAKP